MGIFSIISNALAAVATDVVLAVLTLLFGLVLGKLLGKTMLLLLHEFELDELISEITGFELPLSTVIASAFSYMIYIVFIIFGLSILGIASKASTTIAVIIGIISILYLLLGLQDFVPNAFAGIIVHARKDIIPGTSITAQGINGSVLSSSLTETRILTKQGDTVSIPNVLLLRQPYIVHKK